MHCNYNATWLAENNIYNERELLLRIAEGDEQAFGIFFNRYWKTVLNYLERIIKNPETSEEIVVDIFVKIWLTKQKLPEIENVGAYLRTISRNKALDFIKGAAVNKRQRKEYQLNAALYGESFLQDNITDRELKEAYEASILQLSPQRKKVFLMHRDQGMSYKEIADTLKISPTTVKKTMSEAHASIKEYLRLNYGLYSFLCLLLTSK